MTIRDKVAEAIREVQYHDHKTRTGSEIIADAALRVVAEWLLTGSTATELAADAWCPLSRAQLNLRCIANKLKEVA